MHSKELAQSSSREVCTAPTSGLSTGWEEVDGEDKQTLPLLLHSCSIQWTQQPLTDSILKSSSMIAFCLYKDLLGALQKWKAGHVLCAPAPKPYRENTSRKGQQQWGLNALLCFEPVFSFFHVHGKKQHFLRWKHLEQHWSGFCLGSKRGGRGEEQCTWYSCWEHTVDFCTIMMMMMICTQFSIHFPRTAGTACRWFLPLLSTELITAHTHSQHLQGLFPG